jgi:hypothetical protein
VKTFVLEINEQPAAVFRATDVKAAVKWAKKKRGGGWWYIVRFRATTAGVREATIAEQAAWRARAVEAQGFWLLGAPRGVKLVSLVISEGYTEAPPGNRGLAGVQGSQIHNPLYSKYLLEIEFDWPSLYPQPLRAQGVFYS